MDFEHEKRLTQVEEMAKSNERRIEDVEKKQNDLSELVGTVKVLATREEQVEKDVGEIKTDVKALTSKPAKRWEAITGQIITIIVSAVVGFILAKIGL